MANVSESLAGRVDIMALETPSFAALQAALPGLRIKGSPPSG